MKSVSIVGLVIALSLAGCGSNTPSDGSGDTGKIAPPSWIQGKWTGGSPIVLHLNFTSDRILDEDGKDALPNYVEVEKSDMDYSLERGSEISYFEKVSATSMKWLISNGTITTVVSMKKK